MKDLAGLTVSNEIYKVIEDAVFVEHDTPYRFSLYGTNGYGGAYQNATTRLEKIKKWANRKGAEVTVISRPAQHKIIVEITDPVAAYIEKHLASIR